MNSDRLLNAAAAGPVLWSPSQNPEISAAETARYLGLGSAMPDPPVQRSIESCIAELGRVMEPRCVFRLYSITGHADTAAEPAVKNCAGPAGEPAAETCVELAGTQLRIRSRALSANLRGCSKILLFGATAGPGADRLIRRAEVTSMARAAVLQAAGAAAVEAICDALNRKVDGELRKEGLFCRPRFSPGYGDFPLSYQKDISRMLDLPKNIGVTLTDSLMMLPSKSVTAVIGISDRSAGCPPQGCEVCDKHNECAYSRTRAV
ncbi:MAG: Vitamin B12 dependent methionine synthase activation subunit [Lachnospiraceae bacterium]|jgi:hypothetical protein|nr:Vitamin B12 dependent methionine synthase activation subunit [Lachnospiraceae bacterium]